MSISVIHCWLADCHDVYRVSGVVMEFASREEERRLEETDAQIREKECMLLKVRETLQGYHHMR